MSSGSTTGTPTTASALGADRAPLLPLDTWRAAIGLPPWQFWGFAGGIVTIDSKCSPLTYEYSWQGSDAAGRDDLRRAIVRAEEMLRVYLGYRVAPAYVERTIDWARDYTGIRLADVDATGRRVAVNVGEFYLRAMGVERLTLLGTATTGGGGLVYSAQFNAALEDTFTITVPTTTTDPREIGVYFAAADRWDGSGVSERWRVQPVAVTIASGIATIVGRKWLVGRPILYQNPVATALNPTTAGNFVTSLEVYQRTTDGDGQTYSDAQATLLYESALCCGGTTDPGATGYVVARAGVRDGLLGLVTPAAASYDSTTGAWSQSPYGSCVGEPDRVTLRYLAGYPLDADGQMSAAWRDVVTALAAAELKRRICACRETNERLHDLQQDLALESTQSEKYQATIEELNNPFGTRRGHIAAWRRASLRILRRGITA